MAKLTQTKLNLKKYTYHIKIHTNIWSIFHKFVQKNSDNIMGLMKIEKEKKCKNKKNKEEKITERWFISLNYFSLNKKKMMNLML